MASHASRFSLLDLPRPWRSALPLLAFALVALALEADPRMRLAGAAAAGCFGVAASLRALQARAELRAIRRAAARLILSDAGGSEGSELVRWRITELAAPATRPEEALEPRRLRRVLVGRPMRTGQIHETLLPEWLALPIFASDPLSSVAYATESALVVLVAASATSAHLVFPISIGIACLLGIVVLSYRQTVRVYETSGGAYVVARENLGTTPSLVAAAALLTDYVLTVAVSISAGIYAITSFAPSLSSHKVA